jgi:hypothetical protein
MDQTTVDIVEFLNLSYDEVKVHFASLHSFNLLINQR